jgi:vacuolar-type H+-ATPase subunit F/Vma7
LRKQNETIVINSDVGAEYGNRTRVSTMARSCATIIPIPHLCTKRAYIKKQSLSRQKVKRDFDGKTS